MKITTNNPTSIILDGTGGRSGLQRDQRYIVIINGKPIYLRHGDFYLFARLVLMADFNGGWILGDRLYLKKAVLWKYLYRLKHFLYCDAPFLKGWPVAEYSTRIIGYSGLIRLKGADRIAIEVSPGVMQFDDARVTEEGYNWLSRHDRPTEISHITSRKEITK